MSTDSELLIKIKTILESEGLDAAKAKLNELTKANNASSLSEAAVNRERDNSSIKAEKTARSVMALNGALEGGMGPFKAAINVANQLGGALSRLTFKITAIGSAFAVGFKIGSGLGDRISGAKAAEEELKRIQTESDKLRQRISDLNNIKLTAIRKEAEALAKDFSTAIDKAERLKRLSDLREDAQLASDLAGLELRFKQGKITSNERDRQEIQLTNDSQMRKLHSEERRINTEENSSKKRKSEKVQTWSELSKNYGYADQSYSKGIETVKGFGFKNPDVYASSGILSDDDKALLEGFREKVKEEENQVEFFSKNGMPKQAAIHTEMLAEAKKPEDTLNNLRELKVQKDLARHVFDEFKGINNTGLTQSGEISPYKKTMDEEALRQEQLEADKAVLVNNYAQQHSIRKSGLTGIQSRINTDFDQAVSDVASPADKARSKGRDLLDALKLDHRTVLNNAGDPLSAQGQAAYDQSRSQSATQMVNSAMNQAYKGGNSDELTSALVTALKNKAGAELMLRKDQVKEILDAIQSIGKQSAETAEAVKNLKSQVQTAPGLS